MKKISFLFFIILWSTIISYADEKNGIKEISLDYIYYVPKHLSQIDAKRIAEENAIQEALAKEFGVAISATDTYVIKDENKKYSDFFTSYSSSSIKGEWISNKHEPKFVYRQDKLTGEQIIDVSICIYAKAITRAPVLFEVLTLKNGLETRFQSDSFLDGDDFYLQFKTPIDGFLAVFFMDCKHNVYGIYPYPSDPGKGYKVKKNIKNILFSYEIFDDSNPRKYCVQEFKMTCDLIPEQNNIFVVFSPNQFNLPILENNDKSGILSLSLRDFQQWMSQMRVSDKDFQEYRQSIIVRPLDN